MTPERWEEINRVWQAVIVRPERDRAAAVAELSAGDERLRQDVESLLAHLARASAAGFGAAPLAVAAPRMSLRGRQLGPYAVQALIGVGGMGLRQPILDPWSTARPTRRTHTSALIVRPCTSPRIALDSAPVICT